MINIANAKEMQLIDTVAIKKYGIDGTLLMERAGLSVVSKINEIFSIATPGSRISTVIILCGGGNNGGDGFVIGRILHNQGHRVKIFITVKPEALRGDAKLNYSIAKKFGVEILDMKGFISGKSTRLNSHCLIVDAIFGTGLSKDIRTPVSQIIKKINNSSARVFSVDIPSGISSDTGQIMGCAVKAEYTVTFGLAKRGHFLYPGADYTGKLFIEDIGFPRTLLESGRIKVRLPEKKDVLALLPERLKNTHKGSYGHVLLIAGSRGKTGAALMAARACLRTGAGLVTIGVPESLVDTFQSRVTEEMILPLSDKGNGTLSIKAFNKIQDFLAKSGDVLAIGPGLSVDNEISALLCKLITKSKAPLVIDADGLNALRNNTMVLKKSRTPIILTPHPGEMAQLLKKKLEIRNPKSEIRNLIYEIEKDRITTAASFTKNTGAYLVLKGVPTITAVPEGTVYINPTGNPGMATAGTGDVLTGIISGLLSQGLDPENASFSGAYIHGLIGDITATKRGERSLMASDIINAIPSVFKSLKTF